jgi:serine/threonine-protein kinase HipA
MGKFTLNKNDEIILAAFEATPVLTVSDLEKVTAIARRTLQGRLKLLVENGYITAEGEKKGRYYKRVYSPVTKRVLAVLLDGQPIGELSYGGGQYSFTYEAGYEGEMLPTFPSKTESYVSATLFAYFENFIPEHERREKLRAGREELAEVLPELRNAHGSIEFVPKEKLYQFKTDYSDRPNWLVMKKKILGENDFPNILDIEIRIDDEILDSVGNTEHSNLSGYQTKIDVRFDENGVLIEDLSGGADYLLKPRNLEKSDYFGEKDGTEKRYYPFLAINEHLFMSFAKNELGFNVPESSIIKAKQRDYHYLVKRYDRYNAYRYDQTDFAQYAGIVSDNKYKQSSESLFKMLNDHLSAKEEKMEALRFYYYGYLIKHADLHLKNIGTLTVGKGKRILTPLYDVISVGIYKGDCDDLSLPMEHPKMKPRNWRLKEFYKLAGIIGISEQTFRKEAYAITRAFIAEMPKYIERVRMMEEEHDLNMNTGRAKLVQLSTRLENMFNEKIISLKRLGILNDLKLTEFAGGPLSREKAFK